MNVEMTAVGRHRFQRRIAASAEQLIPLRTAFASWLRALIPPLSAIRLDDIVLASYEAMANSTEHAYPGIPDGEVSIEATYDRGELVVTVADRGTWKISAGVDPLRGRGLPLIRALTDRDDVHRDPGGTQVTMTWLDAVSDPV